MLKWNRVYCWEIHVASQDSINLLNEIPKLRDRLWAETSGRSSSTWNPTGNNKRKALWLYRMGWGNTTSLFQHIDSSNDVEGFIKEQLKVYFLSVCFMFRFTAHTQRETNIVANTLRNRKIIIIIIYLCIYLAKTISQWEKLNTCSCRIRKLKIDKLKFL